MATQFPARMLYVWGTMRFFKKKIKLSAFIFYMIAQFAVLFMKHFQQKPMPSFHTKKSGIWINW